MTLDYKPSEEFQVSKLQSLLDFDVTGAKELWLIQCPISHVCFGERMFFLFDLVATKVLIFSVSGNRSEGA